MGVMCTRNRSTPVEQPSQPHASWFLLPVHAPLLPLAVLRLDRDGLHMYANTTFPTKGNLLLNTKAAAA